MGRSKSRIAVRDQNPVAVVVQGFDDVAGGVTDHPRSPDLIGGHVIPVPAALEGKEMAEVIIMVGGQNTVGITGGCNRVGVLGIDIEVLRPIFRAVFSPNPAAVAVISIGNGMAACRALKQFTAGAVNQCLRLLSGS